MKLKTLFIDRDGTLIREPDDEQIDSIDKLEFMPGVFEALVRLRKSGFRLVMVTNQDGLGTPAFPARDFEQPQQRMLSVFESQGIVFDSIRICPHRAQERCFCRKPEIGLVEDFLRDQSIDRERSAVIGDRQSDVDLAKRLGIASYRLDENTWNWPRITDDLLLGYRTAQVQRQTSETAIAIRLNIDACSPCVIDTGLRFFDHMLEQVIQHAGVSADIKATGDVDVDDHHTIEDVALALGNAFKRALGDKVGIGRYGFWMPMDESTARMCLDLSGRPFCRFDGEFTRDRVGDLSMEMVPHFFESFSQALGASVHVFVEGENAHHQCEAVFKVLGRCLRQACRREGLGIPSTKGVL